MCGILGNIGIGNYSISLNQFQLINDMLVNRGPDDEGVTEFISNNNNIKLGHRRLSILDLSESGSQPMMSFSQRFVITFNGEIYNHRELRKEINELTQINWKGTSDTETLINLFEIYDFDTVLHKLEGMFAFGLFDKKKDLLYLVRDIAGEKPLYLSTGNNYLSFSSDIKPLTKFPNFNKTLDKLSVQKYLKYNYIPSPHSVYKNTFKLPEASYIKISTENFKINSYENFEDLINNNNIEYKKWWKPQYNNTKSLFNHNDFVNQVEVLLKKSISQQLISDVPLGAFLSGGLDSSLVVSLMQTMQNKTKTFTIGSNDSELDESVNAKKIANFLDTEHTNYNFNDIDYKNLIPEIQSSFTEPFADSSQLPTMLVSKIAKKHVKVSLSGDGGDELFGGYNRYIYANKYWRLINMLPSSYRSFILKLISNIPSSLFLKLMNIVFINSSKNKWKISNINKIKEKLRNINNEKSFYFSLITEWNENSGIMNLGFDNESDFKNIRKIFDGNNNSIEQKMMEADFKMYLPDDILCKVDRASMNYSLETRSPYLSKDLIDLSFNIPTKFKVSKGVSKIILRDVLKKYLPNNLTNMPKKGFAIPIKNLMKNEIKEWVNDTLSESACDKHGLFNYEIIRKIKDDHENNISNNEYKLWSLVQFNEWYNKNF